MTIEDLLPIIHQSPTTALAIMVWLQVRDIGAKLDLMVEKLAKLEARSADA